jgi:DNA replicative helicase MCM subunit Mcm2 (Cdc46/Mcm family)
MTRAYEEIIDFIAAGTTPKRVIAFQPSEEVKARVADLIHREKTNGLSSEESSELNQYLQLEHLIRLAKARARAHLADEQLH